MKLIRGLHNLSPFHSGCVATIGNFDGVHLGHREIIRQVREKAAELGLPSVVMVFEPQPREFFQGAEAPARLMRFREKLEAIAAEGVDWLLCLQFNRRLRQMSAREFVSDVLVKGLRLRHLVVGDDFRFGCDRQGDFTLLESMGASQGYTVEHTHTVTVTGARVSSSRIRALLQQSQFDEAAVLLSRHYTISGCVVHGRKLGREMGAPTANISLGRKKPVLRGVYAVTARLEGGRCLPGIANIGLRPTVDGQLPALEVHLFDFDESLYGQHVQVDFIQKLRDEQKFAGIDELRTQIFDDIRQARQVHARGV